MNTFNELITIELIPVYTGIFLLFYIYFKVINKYILHKNEGTPHVIDAHVTSPGNFFDTEYVVNAKIRGYNIGMYKKLYLPADTIFPVVYTLLFLSSALVVSSWQVYPLVIALILLSAILDYCENLTFLIMLNRKDNKLAPVVAFFTTIKTLLFVVNILAAIVFNLLRISGS